MNQSPSAVAARLKMKKAALEYMDRNPMHYLRPADIERRLQLLNDVAALEQQVATLLDGQPL